MADNDNPIIDEDYTIEEAQLESKTDPKTQIQLSSSTDAAKKKRTRKPGAALDAAIRKEVGRGKSESKEEDTGQGK